MFQFSRNLIINTSSLVRSTSTYKSALSLEHLYPNSSLKLATPTKAFGTDNENFSGYIPLDKLQITFSRSSGPGGQNVNKVNTKVDVRFNVQSATWLSDKVRSKLTDKLKNKLTKEGDLIVRSDLTRFQHLNLADCLHKIRNSIRDSLVEHPEPVTDERMRRRHEAAVRERLAIKRARSQIKQDRQNPAIV